MSRLTYTCYRHIASDDFNRSIPAPALPVLAEGLLYITHENQVSEPFPQYCSFVAVKVTADCALAFSVPDKDGNPVDPVADPDFHFVSAGEYRFYGVRPGGKLAVIEVFI